MQLDCSSIALCIETDINRWPYTLGPTATLTRAFQLFRLMGLRHLIISTFNASSAFSTVLWLIHCTLADKCNRVVGIITRKDLVHVEVEEDDHEELHLPDISHSSTPIPALPVSNEIPRLTSSSSQC